jgi:hypothetical protein
MAHARQLVPFSGKASPLFFEIVTTLASIIFFATGVLVLEQHPAHGSRLAAFFAVTIGVFGLYGTVMGILEILDIVRPRSSPPAASH